MHPLLLAVSRRIAYVVRVVPNCDRQLLFRASTYLFAAVAAVLNKVLLTGWRVGELHWGGYAQRARVKSDWLVRLPEGLTTEYAMAVGTAGFTAMLAIMAFLRPLPPSLL